MNVFINLQHCNVKKKVNYLDTTFCVAFFALTEKNSTRTMADGWIKHRERRGARICEGPD